MANHSCSFRRAALSVVLGAASTTMLLHHAAGLGETFYLSVTGWLTYWPTLLLPLWRFGFGAVDRLVILFACNTLLHSTLINLALQQRDERLRLM